MLIWFISKSLSLMIFSFVCSFLLFYYKTQTMFHLDLNSFIEMPLTLTFLIDSQSLLFLSTVSMVSSIIVIYSFFYLEGSSTRSMKKFLMILITFVISMFILSISANIFSLMIGWDGLGISSFCLIIFYQNWKSFASGMVTFMSNRLGDSLIIISMIWIALDKSLDCFTLLSIFPISLLFLLGAFSKSAQFPYLFWLPQAMAAPTPVSALVHSSTLVTAGIYTSCRFHNVISTETQLILLFISSITMIISGMSSLLEFDLKKVIALSTLCHVSMMMMFSVLGEIHLSLFHLMMHAFFKSLLFMVAGYLIHMNCNSQDIRLISESTKNLNFSLPFLVSTFSMMGLPFLSGFYSKEALFVNSFFPPSLMMPFLFLTNSFFSCAYSVRLMSYVFSNRKKSMITLSKDWFGTILLFSSIFSSFLGGLILPMVLENENSIQPQFTKSFLILFSVLGILVGTNINKIHIKPLIQEFLNNFWKSDLLYKIFQKHFFSLSSLIMWKIDKKGITKKTLNNVQKTFDFFFMYMSILTLREPFSMIKSFHFLIASSLFWVL